MSLPLTPDQLSTASALPLRTAILALLTDPAGPLGDCAARPEDAPAAYMLARIYRHARAQGHLHGKPGYEAEALFAARVRSTIRRSADPFAFAEKLARAMVLRFRDRGLVHFVPDLSPASHAMHRALGFEVWRRHGAGTWYRLPKE